MSNFELLCRNAKNCSYTFSLYSEKDKNAILDIMANSLLENYELILHANNNDILNAKENNKPKQFIDRLYLDKSRIISMAEGILQVRALKDPIGEVKSQSILKNGLEIKKVAVPFGVVGIIYEARPNVTSDAAALCVKSGNVCVLRGSKDAINSNIAIIEVFKEALIKNNYKEDFINLIVDTSHDSFNKLIKMNNYVDVIIPRGGASLIKATIENATVPVIETGTGNCHLYIEKTADYNMAKEILLNGKITRPSVCNALESLLIDKDIASEFLPKLIDELIKANVEVRGCEETLKICQTIKAATEDDFYSEFIDYIISVKVVNDIDNAIMHINKYSTHHSDCIVTSCKNAEDKFLKSIDSACVYANASTRFTDGFEFGLGAEIGISTQKLHARGPMGLEEMTSYKYQIKGNGQIR